MKNPINILDDSELKALRITSTFETGKELNFAGLAGNFDGQGLSFGILQWNIKSQTLQPLLIKFAGLFPDRLATIFGKDAESFRKLMLERQPEEQFRFALSINDSKNRIIEPWKTRFACLGDDPEMRAIQINAAKILMNCAADYAADFGFKSERAFVFLFDIVTQHGPYWLINKNRKKMISKKLGAPKVDFNEKAAMRVIAEILTATVKPAFSLRVSQRRNIVIDGRGLLGKRRFDLERDFGLGDKPYHRAA
ncbi:MAG: chitosanase [candidate division Zixibacteria bacterium]|jgi:hypothetical protein|nr:chitosanase [candidate division Zixibacteria bacterium]